MGATPCTLSRALPRLHFFVNALAILIFMAQLPELVDVTWVVYPMAASGLAINYLFPRLTKVVPSPLIAVLVLTGVAVAFKLDVRTIGDMVTLPDSVPSFLIPDVPLVGSGAPATRQQLAWAAELVHTSSGAPVTAVVPGEPETALADYALHHGLELLVIGAYGHSRIRHLIVGSTTTILLRTSSLAVLVMR